MSNFVKENPSKLNMILFSFKIFVG